MRIRGAQYATGCATGCPTVALVALAVACGACGASGSSKPPTVPCGEVSTCPNDPPPTQADKDACTVNVSGPCGPYYQAYHDCYGTERVCAFNGTTDVDATQTACEAESLRVGACLNGTSLDAGL